jgi:inner membrane protein
MQPKTEKAPITKFDYLTGKILVILGLALTLLIPLTQVEIQISDRREYEKVAQKQIAEGWGDEVHFSSPYIKDTGQTVHSVTSDTVFSIYSKEKKRGVFQVPVYVATMNNKISFARTAQRKDETKIASAPRSEFLIVPFKPAGSIQSFKVIDVATGRVLKGKISDDGIKVAADEMQGKTFFGGEIEVEVVARGSGLLTYNSNADQDVVRMLGNWTKPKFLEDVLPTDTKLNKKGFEAQWALNALPKWDHGKREAKIVGLTHLWVGTDYVLIERAVKYGILFIALTFLLVFIVEFMANVKIHPLQYASIGLAISLFYLLLLALSESIGFHFAYVISTIAVTGLIVFYVRGFLKQKKFTYMIFGQQITLSGFFYTLLSIEESAFLVGSLGLFAALAVFMAVTRNFDWYSGSFNTTAGCGSKEARP